MTLLESPLHQWGQPGQCPRCQGEFTVPRDDVLHRLAGDRGEGAPFAFTCPGLFDAIAL
jgi:hypothetical protein